MYSISTELINNSNIESNDEVIDENKLIQTNTDYKRDSFDDRVCDDLSEVLLSYLSFEDKFGFECISKQWKSLVFNKHKKLSFSYEMRDAIITKGKLNLHAFESILSKCKRIDSIDIEFNCWDASIDKEENSLTLQLITKHCNGLKSIRYDFSGIDMKTIESFGHKFGKSLYVLYGNPSSLILKFCHRLVSIENVKFSYLFDSNFENNGYLLDKNEQFLLITKKLESFDIEIYLGDIKRFEYVINKYKETLKVVSIRPSSYRSHFHITEFLNQLSNIVNLKELHINLEDNDWIDIGSSSLALISQKCVKLEKFTLYGFVLFNNIPFKLITNFKQLKYLSINSNLFSDENGEKLSIKSFKGLKNLIHLTLYYIGSDFFIDIDKYLPQLRSLKVDNVNSFDLTEQIVYHLSKLESIVKLEIIEIRFKPELFVQLINSWKQIKSIKLLLFRDTKCFSNNFIHTLISLAVKRPEIEFEFSFYYINRSHLYWDQLMNKPNNIKIILCCRPYTSALSQWASVRFIDE